LRSAHPRAPPRGGPALDPAPDGGPVPGGAPADPAAEPGVPLAGGRPDLEAGARRRTGPARRAARRRGPDRRAPPRRKVADRPAADLADRAGSGRARRDADRGPDLLRADGGVG